MRDLNKSTHVWNGSTAFIFAFSVCAVYWTVFIAGSFFADRTITVSPPRVQFTIENRFIDRVITVSSPNIQFTIETGIIILSAASFLPALYCFCRYPECRASIKRLDASWTLYFVAVATGLCLPFLSYPGSHYRVFPWGQAVTLDLARVFALNLFLAPMWEEIVWRGCFLKKVRSFTSASSGILLMSVGWTIWSGADAAFSYRAGARIEVLCVWLVTYFCLGIILGSVFEMGSGSLWPCILLHSAFNAAAIIYYTEPHRASDLGSYVSELIFTAIAAALFFWADTRRNRVPVEAPGVEVPQT